MIKAFMTCGQILRWRASLVSLLLLSAGVYAIPARAQVNSGSNGSDGAFHPTTNTVIDMADHPDGIYHYSSVSIPADVTVTFIPNADNTPIVWLVQSNCIISGTVSVAGQGADGSIGGRGGPGGWAGGSGGAAATAGQGPGGGTVGGYAVCASYGSLAANCDPIPRMYGNQFLLPLLGGSGGGGTTGGPAGGGGGGGAILIAASGQIQLDGNVDANGGYATYIYWGGIAGGAGSGGAVRLVATTITGNGTVSTDGRTAGNGNPRSGAGRVRFDSFASTFGGTISGSFTQGLQPIIIPTPGQGIQLAIQSVGGVAAPATPTGVLVNPDVIIPAQQVNPVPVVVQCSNVPLNTEITVEVHPANGAVVRAVSLNNVGTQESSTATVSVNMPRGGGIIFAKAVTGINSNSFASVSGGSGAASIAHTGWTADGESFVAVEVTASLGGGQQLAYLTASGKRYKVPTL